MNRIEFFKKLPLKGKVADLGCSAGSLHGMLKERKPDAIGVDVSGRADIICDLNARVPFNNGSVDTLIAAELIEHLENPLRFLKECRRVLKRNGRLILTTPNTDSLLAFYAGATGSYNKEHLFLFNRGSMSLLLKKAGFEKYEISFLDPTSEDGNCGKRPLWAQPFRIFTRAVPSLKFHLCVVARK